MTTNEITTDHNIDYTTNPAPTECPFAGLMFGSERYPRMTVEITADSDWHCLLAGDRTFAWFNGTGSMTLWTPAHFCEWSTGIQCRIVED
jgi:hypothetical protein